MTAARSRAERFGGLDLSRVPSAMEQRASSWTAPKPPVPAPSASAAATGRVVSVPVASELRGADRRGPPVIGAGPAAPARFPYMDHRTIDVVLAEGLW